MESENTKLTFSDFMLKWTEFQIKYNQTLYQAWLESVKSALKEEDFSYETSGYFSWEF